MKKNGPVRFGILLVVALLLVSCLAACKTKLSGTYTADGLVKQSFTFNTDDTVVISAFGVEAEGTYVIEDGKITITYKLLNFSYDWEKSFEKKGDTIIIDGTAFVKE